MRVGLIGLNYNTAPVRLREHLAVSQADAKTVFDGLHQYVAEAVVLSTCNRIEVYAAVDSLDVQPPLGPLLASLHTTTDAATRTDILEHTYEYWDEAAVSHLFQVAAGLDSMVLGETEILGQVRKALDMALEHEGAGPVLSTLLRRAITVGKRVRTETDLSQNPASIGAAALAAAKHCLGTLEGKVVLIIGAGQMGALFVKLLAEERLASTFLASRSYASAERVARSSGLEPLALDAIADILPLCDAVVSCTAAPHVVLSAESVRAAMAARPGRPICIVDIAVPRDVDPDVAQIPGVSLSNIDDLENIIDDGLQERRKAVPAAQAIVCDEAKQFMAWAAALGAVPVISALRARAEEIRQQEVSKALAQLRHLDERDRYIVAACTAAIVNKLLHEPTVVLKQQVSQGDGQQYADALRTLFGLADKLTSPACVAPVSRLYAGNNGEQVHRT